MLREKGDKAPPKTPAKKAKKGKRKDKGKGTAPEPQPGPSQPVLDMPVPEELFGPESPKPGDEILLGEEDDSYYELTDHEMAADASEKVYKKKEKVHKELEPSKLQVITSAVADTDAELVQLREELEIRRQQ